MHTRRLWQLSKTEQKDILLGGVRHMLRRFSKPTNWQKYLILECLEDIFSGRFGAAQSGLAQLSADKGLEVSHPDVTSVGAIHRDAILRWVEEIEFAPAREHPVFRWA